MDATPFEKLMAEIDVIASESWGQEVHPKLMDELKLLEPVLEDFAVRHWLYRVNILEIAATQMAMLYIMQYVNSVCTTRQGLSTQEVLDHVLEKLREKLEFFYGLRDLDK